ncbi:LysR family transcriptional regulator, partial [Burkholderia pseudomallei]|uniref:LysR family transcriptional regulator n=1 Tax=Burkholderia pseudomallei TaxID=28450 RepID=UPI001C830920
AERRAPNAARRTPRAERRAPNAERRTPRAERRAPNAERRTAAEPLRRVRDRSSPPLKCR